MKITRILAFVAASVLNNNDSRAQRRGVLAQVYVYVYDTEYDDDDYYYDYKFD